MQRVIRMLDNSKNHRFFIKAFGCQYNEFDATELANELKLRGFVESTLDEADFVFVLNCSVRKTGVDRAMGFIRNLTEKYNKKVYLSGCILEADKKRFGKKGVRFFDLNNINKLFGNELRATNTQLPTTSKFIPIMKGCNNFCSYCVVPYTRGREISRPFDEVIADVKKVVASGHKEVWLLGQNVNSYQCTCPTYSVIPAEAGIQDSPHGSPGTTLKNTAGPEDDGLIGFADLLVKINDLSGDFIIYFTSNHPKDMSDEIIGAIAKLPKVVKIINLPIQSGSDKVLRSMKRPYTIEQYLRLVQKIKKKIPNIKITTDVIVGYPTETEDDFQKTVTVFKSIGYFQAYINKYSPREGTAAHKLGDPIPWLEKERRWRILNEIANNK